MNKKIVSRSLLVLIGLVLLIAAIFVACGGGGGGSTLLPGKSTTKFVGTQSPGDYWSWTVTTNSSGSGSFTAENITGSLTYSGSIRRLRGDSAGISSMVVTSTTDTHITTPASAFAIEIPGTALMVATAPTFTFDHDGIVELSGRPPIIAAAQGSCLASGATVTVNWIEMPGVGWCPTALASNPTKTCTTPDNAYGTAEIISGDTYTVHITYYRLDGTQGGLTSSTMPSCTCSEGVIQCEDMGGRPIRIAFTPSGVFFMDTSYQGVAGIVQPAENIDIADFRANGRSFKGMWYKAWDDFSSGCSSDSECTAYPGGTCLSGHCGIPETSPMSITADGTKLNAVMYSDIKNSMPSAAGGSISFSNVSQPAPGLIRAELASACSSTTDVVMAVRKIQNKYVGLLVSHSPCPTFDTGFNVLTIEQ